MYNDFSFLKVWWQGSILVFLVWWLLLSTLTIIKQRATAQAAGVVVVLFFIMGLAGFYTSYHDFNHTLSHKLLGGRFHTGVYMFWIGWIAIIVYTVFGRRPGNMGEADNATNNQIKL